ncbi:histone deacetylase [Polychaeton citri CBS 116435]|uniref:histone deacetylase n=1 Tax=Polychaeton citri CBS 116435 TaxID=1314669 RepID=A0A9P4PWB7_9PEZI|nr:histone deacetylase [Polychaeton citri CBS 116435]
MSVTRGDIRDNIVQSWSPSNHTLRSDNNSPYPRSNRSPRPSTENTNGEQTSTNGHTNGGWQNGDGNDMDVGDGAHGYTTINGHHHVQSLPSPDWTEDDERLYRDQELNENIMRQVEENNITRPRGYKVSFHYNSRVEDMHFGKTHPMKPWRLTLTKHLVLGFGLHHAMDTYQAVAAGKDQIRAFHDSDYVDFLSEVAPETFEELCKIPRFYAHTPPRHENDTVELGPFNLSTSPGADCPVFDGMSTYLFLYTGATLHATQKLLTGQSDIAINWSGGLHHAHKSEASGFCYINDIVLSILDLLRVHARVLYIDIDVHHGDGVEEAFQRQPRVMTLSYHRYGPYDETGHKFFPGTGDISDIGLRGTVGEHFALNVPIPSGIDDRQYSYLFESITSRTIEAFNPSCIVLQCGADSLGGDRLGQFNINIKQHGDCVSFVKKFRLPLLLLGGGGYTARNVARAWCHETALATNNTLPDAIPMHIVPRPEAFSGRVHGDGKLYPSFQRLHLNDCKDGELEAMVKQVDWELKYVRNSPWVKTQMERLPKQDIMEEIYQEQDDMLKQSKIERDRKWKERNPAGPGELR